MLSPLRDAHSEILARTAPNIYDVLIALFGGLAGILATSSKQKGNVIPGVAIATALMPPLCTAGYGLATLQFKYFFGAFYLFLINTVFIAMATFVMVRILHVPEKDLHNAKATRKAHRIVWSIVLLTLIPALYLGYDIVKQDRFTKNANRFIQIEAHLTNDYLLSKKIDAKNERISLVFGGKEITTEEIKMLKNKLQNYNIPDATLEVKQGFSSYSGEEINQEDEQYNALSKAFEEKEKQQKGIQLKLDSIDDQQKLGLQIYSELKVQHPSVKKAIIEPTVSFGDSVASYQSYLVLLTLSKKISQHEKLKIEKWLKVRLHQNNINLILQ
jgi:uncharacterized membrane protein